MGGELRSKYIQMAMQPATGWLARCVHKDLLSGESHGTATAMESTKGQLALKASATTAPGLRRMMPTAIACRNVRATRRLL